MRFQMLSEVSDELSKRPCSFSLCSTIISKPASLMERVCSSRAAAAASLAASAFSMAAALSSRL